MQVLDSYLFLLISPMPLWAFVKNTIPHAMMTTTVRIASINADLGKDGGECPFPLVTENQAFKAAVPPGSENRLFHSYLLP